MASPSQDRNRGELRVPPLSGALNFRDMGGYRAADGRTVRWHLLYRSGTTHLLTGDDLDFLVSHGVRHAYDLRSNSERRRHPNRLEGVAQIHFACFDHDKLPGDFLRLIKQPDAHPDASRDLMFSVYRDLPYEFRAAYRDLFARLADGDLPLVFNCTAGKDRTGVAAALVLTALGIPRETVFEDYRLTDLYYDRSCEIMTQGEGMNLLAGIDRRIWEPMMRADPAYLAAMFDRLTTAHGSPANYLAEELGVGAVMVERIRSELLEPVS